MVAIELLVYDTPREYALELGLDGSFNIRRDGVVSADDEQAFIELCMSAWRAYQAGRPK